MNERVRVVDSGRDVHRSELEPVPAWSREASTVWGKTSGQDPGAWMPLVQHLDDAGRMAALLWDDWLPASVRRVIELGLPEGSRDGRSLVSWLAGIHDVGKSSPVFSSQVPHLADRMRDLGAQVSPLITRADRKMARHAAVGQVALEQWLKHGFSAPPDVRASYASVVGTHHGQAPTSAELVAITRRRDLVGEGVWDDVRREILTTISRRSRAVEHLPVWCGQVLPTRVQVLVTAVVIVADWMASSQDHFELVTEPCTGPERAARAWADLGLPGPWEATADTDDVADLLTGRFPQLAGLAVRPVQQLCHDVAARRGGPALMVVEAPMGVGKTEAALLAAEVMARRSGMGGVFMGLPSMATSDAMYARLIEWIDHLPGEGSTSTFLAHSKAGHNQIWQGLLREARLAEISDEDAPADHTIARAVSWLNGRKRGVLANFVVGTIDQALFAALSVKHVMLRHLAMAGKVVILDEVHAADAYMRVYLERTLSWLSAYGVPVILLSATLPSTQRRHLVEAYASSWGHHLPDGGVGAYPLVTVADSTGIEQYPVPGPHQHKSVAVHSIDDDDQTLLELLAERLPEGGCVGIIRNTVARAQHTYRLLRQVYGEDVVLLHSRFLGPDRALREQRLREFLGRDGSRRPTRLIVVGTQVLEQSLDVDFDLMLSDVAPVDLVLQRAGRLHRHSRPRPPMMQEATLLLTGISGWQLDGPMFESGLTAVYPEALLLRACAALDLHRVGSSNDLGFPQDIRDRVERAYSASPGMPAGWEARAVELDERHRREMAASVGRAAAFLLPDLPDYEQPLVDFFSSWAAADAEDRQGSAAVRDGADSLEVVVVRRKDGGVWSMPGEGRYADRQLPDIGPPPLPLAKALSGCTLRLPAAFCQPWLIDRVIDELEDMGFPDWQQSSWLQGQLVLVLDEEFKASLAGFELEYDTDLGLIHSRETRR